MVVPQPDTSCQGNAEFLKRASADINRQIVSALKSQTLEKCDSEEDPSRCALLQAACSVAGPSQRFTRQRTAQEKLQGARDQKGWKTGTSIPAPAPAGGLTTSRHFS